MDKPICTIDGCGKTRKARGWCSGHYARWQKTGDTRPGEPLMDRIADPYQAFAARTKRQGRCLIWTGAKVRGYGTLTADGRTEYVHRWIYEQTHGPIPSGAIIDHICQISACVEVTHLRAVTRAQNNSYRRGPMHYTRSGVRNVHWSEQKRRWFVQVKGEYFGSFMTVAEATPVAEAARKELFGEFAGKG